MDNSPTNYTDPSGLNKMFGWITQGMGSIDYPVGGHNVSKSFETSDELAAILEDIDNQHGMISLLAVKGHGSADDVEDPSGNAYIRVVSGSDSKVVNTVTSHGTVSEESRLRRITNSSTVIELHGCWTAPAAEQLAKSLKRRNCFRQRHSKRRHSVHIFKP